VTTRRLPAARRRARHCGNLSQAMIFSRKLTRAVWPKCFHLGNKVVLAAGFPQSEVDTEPVGSVVSAQLGDA
jgi:hypothetical protein